MTAPFEWPTKRDFADSRPLVFWVIAVPSFASAFLLGPMLVHQAVITRSRISLCGVAAHLRAYSQATTAMRTTTTAPIVISLISDGTRSTKPSLRREDLSG